MITRPWIITVLRHRPCIDHPLIRDLESVKDQGCPRWYLIQCTHCDAWCWCSTHSIADRWRDNHPRTCPAYLAWYAWSAAQIVVIPTLEPVTERKAA